MQSCRIPRFAQCSTPGMPFAHVNPDQAHTRPAWGQEFRTAIRGLRDVGRRLAGGEGVRATRPPDPAGPG